MQQEPHHSLRAAHTELPAVPDDVFEAIERAHDVADELAACGMQLRIRRPGLPRRLRVDLLAVGGEPRPLAPAELLELGAGHLRPPR